MKRGARKNVYILPKRKGQVEEFGPGRAGVVMCPNCHSVYFKKAWQKSAEKFLAKRKNGPEVSFKMCPACTMVKRGLYEGIVTIKDAPAKQMAEIIGLVKNFCAHATEKDPMDRLIAIKKDKKFVTITTTENQLAHKLAKHIIKSFKGSRALTLYGKNDNVTARMEITFPKTA
ncbi:MAG: NMD3-related protein [Patescibacteria group bacterium]